MSVGIHTLSITPGAHRAAGAPLAARPHDSTREAHGPGEGDDGKRPGGRGALLGALTDALNGLAPATKPSTDGADEAPASTAPPATGPTGDFSRKALHDFAHQLIDALRPSGNGDGPGHHGRGFAWGRTSLSDLAQRLEALAQSLLGSAPAEAPVGTPVVPVVPVGTAIAPVVADHAVEPPPAAEPAAGAADATTTPTPVTDPAPAPAPPVAASVPPAAAVVADSPLLAAFRQLLASRSGSAGTADASATASDQLAALLHRMAQALQSDPAGDIPATGNLIDTTA